jgi:hypothetical protein
MTEAVAVAVITGAFGVVGVMVRNLSRSNKKEHAENGGKLDVLIEGQKHLLKGHERIENKVDTHINDHARGDV